MNNEEILQNSRAKSAYDYFFEGYNCTQAIAMAFQDIIPIEQGLMLRMVSSFGGGMGRLREVCGAVSGMFFVAGVLYGYDGPKDVEGKKMHYARIQELARRFREMNGAIVCRELLGLDHKSDAPVPETRTKEYYEKRPCPMMIATAAYILDEYIREQEA